MGENEYGETDVTAEALLSKEPTFNKAGRKERNYNADSVDEYVNLVLDVLRKEHEDRTQAQEALNRTKKRLEEVETYANDLQLQLQSNGTYVASDLNRRIAPFNPTHNEEEAFDSDAWSENLSNTQTRNQTLQEENDSLKARVEELEIRLAKSDKSSILPKDRPTSTKTENQEGEEGDLFSFGEEDEQSDSLSPENVAEFREAWLSSQTDSLADQEQRKSLLSLAADVTSFSEVIRELTASNEEEEFGLFEDPAPYQEEQPVAAQETVSAPSESSYEVPVPPVPQQPAYAAPVSAQGEPQFISNGAVELSDVDKSSILLRQAAEVAEAHLLSAREESEKTLDDAERKAYEIRKKAEEAAQQFVSDAQYKADNAEQVLEDAREVAKQFIRQHEIQKRSMRDFLVSLDEREGGSFEIVEAPKHVRTSNHEEENNQVVKPNDEDFVSDI